VHRQCHAPDVCRKRQWCQSLTSPEDRITVPAPDDECENVTNGFPECKIVTQLRAERDALREMLHLVMSIPNMTNEQLEQLKQNARAAIESKKLTGGS